ncbi:hypothetical protein ACIGFK_36765 [Streptomyces sp. NPDC085524]|uniref:hypothetical protein n=1 Tax=unclassified Streptomyces TaxID=2593676 RepID=UPI0035D9560C
MGGKPAAGLLKALERISRNGGIIQADPPPKAYGFPGGTHINYSQQIQENLWRFKLSPMARDLLDHMAATHDVDGIVAATQTALGMYFGCHHSKISRAIKVLTQHNFAWKARQGQYQLNPTYAYRWGSRRHRVLIDRLGAKTLKDHTIVIPLPETRNR